MKEDQEIKYLKSINSTLTAVIFILLIVVMLLFTALTQGF